MINKDEVILQMLLEFKNKKPQNVKDLLDVGKEKTQELTSKFTEQLVDELFECYQESIRKYIADMKFKYDDKNINDFISFWCHHIEN